MVIKDKKPSYPGVENLIIVECAYYSLLSIIKFEFVGYIIVITAVVFRYKHAGVAADVLLCITNQTDDYRAAFSCPLDHDLLVAVIQVGLKQ